MSDDQLRDYVKRARAIAAPIGPMHSLWDMIFDAEAILAGKETLLPRDRALTAIERSAAEIGIRQGG